MKLYASLSFLACLFLSISGLTASEHGARELTRSQLIEKMQEGGLVIYIRHASTEKDYADQIKADVNDGSTQRVLSEAGWHEAVHIGNAFRFYKIPVGKVYSSEYFRAWQTAWLAFGEYEKEEAFNFLPFEDYTEEQVVTMRKRVMPWVSKVPPAGTNTIIVAHDDPFEAVSGIYPEPQGVTYVLLPKGEDGIEVLGHIAPDGWGSL
ncbi:MAG: histidine phosphatase family protein [Verrucomicrobiota bacterium]